MIRTNPKRALVVRSLVVALAISALAFPAISSATSLKLPKGVTQASAKRMYAEQLDSQVSIRGLVEGKVASFEVTSRSVKGNNAELKLRVVDRNGAVRRGTMRLVRTNGKWYFSSISRVGNSRVAVTPVGRYDVGVLNTILAEQTSHSDTTAKLVDGQYRKVTVGTPKKGYRSVVLPVNFSGTKGKPVKGEVTAIQRTSSGRQNWFVVSFDDK